MSKLRNIKINEEEDQNWNAKIVHFHLQYPHFFFDLLQDIIKGADQLKIKLDFTPKETFLIKQYEVLKNGSS